MAGDDAGDFGCVIEAAFADAAGVQRHRDEPVGAGPGGDGFAEAAAQCGHDAELGMVFEARDQAIEWEAIRQGGVGVVECGGMLEAGAADFAAGRGEGASWALGLTVPGQVGVTSWTHGLPTGGCPAQQAMVRENVIKK